MTIYCSNSYINFAFKIFDYSVLTLMMRDNKMPTRRDAMMMT